jgi:hypothetical protein
MKWTRAAAVAVVIVGCTTRTDEGEARKLVALMGTEDPALRAQLIEKTIALGPAAVEPLVVVLTQDSLEARRAAALEALVALGAIAQPSVPYLVAGLSHRLPANRDSCQAALIGLGELSVPAVIELLRNSSGRLRARAAEVLGGIGPSAGDNAVYALVDALDEETVVVRLRAARALGAMGTTACPAVPSLLEWMHADGHLRHEIETALSKIECPQESAHAPTAAVVTGSAACAAGDAQACSRMSRAHLTGDGVARDPNRAIELAVAACRGGIEADCESLRRLCEAGIGAACPE